MELTYFATNNSCSVQDMDVLHAMGIRILKPSNRPMRAWRDPNSGKMRIDIGFVIARRDGMIGIRPHMDAPPTAMNALMTTAVECLERDLHKRDDWPYCRATKTTVGRWNAEISISVPDGTSIFEEHAEALRPAANRHASEDRDIAEESAIILPEQTAA